ncbi:MAG: hypothetical protein FWD48_00065 [Oscillospiraceae bacterium]|nr:hypothetical protein [Oscillospiraceae bacterium]
MLSVKIKITRKKENWRLERHNDYFIILNQNLNEFNEYIGAKNLKANMKTKLSLVSFFPWNKNNTFIPAYKLDFDDAGFPLKLQGLNKKVIPIKNDETIEITENAESFIVVALSVGGYGVFTSDEIPINDDKHYIIENVYGAETVKALKILCS